MASARAHFKALLFVLCALGGLETARGAEPAVTAVLTDSDTAVGRPVQLEIQVTGASNPKPPGGISVDGLDIRSAGVSRQYQMQNFSVNYSFTFNYTIMPLKAGAFKIPPQTIDAGGKMLRTPELTLNVAASSAQSSRGGRNSTNGSVDPAQVGFIEMILPKAVAYVGEMIPVQVRLGINMRAPVDSLGSGVQIAGQGFTTQKMPEPRQTVETVNGRNYQVFIFKTAIAAVRPGKLEIGPAEINPVVRVPRGGQRNPSLPRDLADDPFFNNFFNDPAFAPSMPKEVNLKSQPATIEVKPLPPNAPASFSGAVGNFSMKSDANPKKANAGDPITVTTTIIGRGNFDRVLAPALEDARGWHQYPPSDSFKQDDDVGISGAKTFETVLSATEKKEKLPPFAFTYFDPVKENYVTLRSDEIPLRIEGGAAPTTAPAAVSAPSPGSSPSATPTPVIAKQADDILGHLDDRRVNAQSFIPLYARHGFWLAQLAPLLLLVGIIFWRVHASRVSDLEARRVALWQQETAELQRKVGSNGIESQQFLADASRLVQLKTALIRKVDPNSVDAEAAATAFRLEGASREHLRALFQQSDEQRYSGGKLPSALPPEKRQEIVQLLGILRA